MTRRGVGRPVSDGERPPYAPWDFSFTHPAREKLAARYGDRDVPVENMLALIETAQAQDGYRGLRRAP